MKQRLSADSFSIPVKKIQSGLYSDAYFLRTREILESDGRHPKVMMQIFQRQHAVLCGIDEAIAIIKKCAYNPEKILIKALYDGDRIEPWETVMTIEGSLADFSHLETVYLGVLARQTKVCTNVSQAVAAANGKPVLFFSSRYDDYHVQAADGYAAHLGGAIGVSTNANGLYWNGQGIGTIPHALIAAYNGDTLAATEAFDKYIDPSINRVALVDFDNDCVNTSLQIARKLGNKLYGVRLDTSNTMVDKSVVGQMGTFSPTGVCPQLVWNVRRALDNEGFEHVKIMVSGGFTANKICEFEQAQVPVDVYAIGSSFFENNINFTADIVMINDEHCAKVGRRYLPNNRLQLVD